MISRKSKNSSKKSSPKRPLLLLDVDQTLIDTPRIKEKLFYFLKNAKAPDKFVAEVRSVLVPFNREGFEGLKHSANPFAKTARREFNKLLAGRDKYVFSGTLSFLRAARRHNELWALTYGDPALQKKKLRNAGIDGLFARIVVTAERSKLLALRKVVKSGRRAVLFDDSEEAVKAAKSLGLEAVLVKRGPKNAAYYRRLLRAARLI